MLQPTLHTTTGERSLIDLQTLGSAHVFEAGSADFARPGATLYDGEWTDAVLAVYGSIDGVGWVDTTERIIASRRATEEVIDLVGWAKIRLEVVVVDSGSGGRVRPAMLAKAIVG